MSIAILDPAVPACARKPEIFQHPLLETPESARGSAQRCEVDDLAEAAEYYCLDCPLMIDCLYHAVVNQDVAGFVAGTTPRDRAAMRRVLGIKVAQEDYGVLAGAPITHHIDHDEVVRLRNANPNESLEWIARRIGCSVSTIKRHMRQERDKKPTSVKATPVVTKDDVIAAYNTVVASKHTSAAA